MQVVLDNANLMWDGLVLTIQLSIVVSILGTFFGTLVGIGLQYGNRVVRTVLRVYSDVVRGLPILVLIFLIFYALPSLDISLFGYHLDTNIGRFQTATLAFTLFTAAHIGEIVRGALASVPLGQTDAGKAIGLTFWQRLYYILLPQSIPVIVPPWTNTAAELIKGTALVSLISMNDLFFSTRKIAERTGEMMPLYLAAGVVYFILCFTVSRSGVWFSQRFKYGVAR